MPSTAKGDVTKKLLTNSLKKLMTEKPLEKISIREITENCGLNRQTFYYHFSDIYEQLKWMYEHEILPLLTNREGALLWQEGLLEFFYYVEENRAVYRCLLKSLWRNHLFQFFYENAHSIVKGTIDTISDGLDIGTEYKEMLSQYYVFSLGSLIENWIYGYITETPEELVKFFDTMIQDQMRGTALRYGIHFDQ